MKKSRNIAAYYQRKRFQCFQGDPGPYHVKNMPLMTLRDHVLMAYTIQEIERLRNLIFSVLEKRFFCGSSVLLSAAEIASDIAIKGLREVLENVRKDLGSEDYKRFPSIYFGKSVEELTEILQSEP